MIRNQARRILIAELLSEGASPALSWYDVAAYADLAAVADFNSNRYAITTVSLANVATATAAELKVKQACTFADWFAFTNGGTNVPRFVTDNVKTQLKLQGAASEACRFSPLMEAILQRSAVSVVVRGQLIGPMGGTTYPMIVSRDADTSLIGSENSNTDASITGGPLATAGSGGFTTGFGVATGLDGAGRSLCFNGGTVATNATAKPAVVTAYLARSSASPSTLFPYADGYYDFVGVSPDRLTDAQLQTLAVPANP